MAEVEKRTKQVQAECERQKAEYEQKICALGDELEKVLTAMF